MSQLFAILWQHPVVVCVQARLLNMDNTFFFFLTQTLPCILPYLLIFLSVAKAQGPVGSGGAAPLGLSVSQEQDQRSLSD